MTIIKARFLGRFYFFLVSFLLLIPVSYGLASIHVLNEVAETYITYDAEGDPVTNYKLETVSEEEWILLKQEQGKLIDIIGGTTVICSMFWGASFGEDVIMNNQSPSHAWDKRSSMMFSCSLLIGTFIWHIVFIVNMYGSSTVIVPKILIGGFINVVVALAGAGNLSAHIGEPIIHKLLALHKI